eukprot:683694-Amphidinium_carterae.2
MQPLPRSPSAPTVMVAPNPKGGTKVAAKLNALSARSSLRVFSQQYSWLRGETGWVKKRLTRVAFSWSVQAPESRSPQICPGHMSAAIP